jgi:arginine repressor
LNQNHISGKGCLHGQESRRQRHALAHTDQRPGRVLIGTLTGLGVALGNLVMLLTNDVILGVIAGSAFIAIIVGMVRLWAGGGAAPLHDP